MTWLQLAVKNGEDDHMNRFFNTLDQAPGSESNVSSAAALVFLFLP